MRLENTDDAVKIHLAGGLERCHHLRRMVCIVINDGCTVCHMAGQLEAAGRTRELLETCCGFLRIQTDENTYRTGSQRIEHVVTARHGQIDMREQLALVHDVKAVVAVVVGDIFRINICLRCGAERDTGAVDACNCLHGVGGVVVDDNGAVFRNQLAEAVERMNDIINVLEEVQMVCIDIEHNGNRRVEAEEGVGVLAGLSDEVIMRADAQRAADGVQIAADHDRRVGTAFDTNHRQHGSGCGLAVGAGYTNGMLVLQHNLAPRLCAFHNRNAQLACVRDFRIVIVNSGGADYEVCAVYVFRQMCVCNAGAQLGQFVCDVGFRAVRAGYFCTEV